MFATAPSQKHTMLLNVDTGTISEIYRPDISRFENARKFRMTLNHIIGPE